MAITTPLHIVQVSGVGDTIQNEVVGTGNTSSDSFDLDFGNVISGSLILKYGAVGSNNLTILTETTHYTIALDAGLIILTSAGVTALDTNILYATYIHSPKITNTLIESYQEAADEETNALTGNKWGVSTQTIEYFDGERFNQYPRSDRPYIMEKYVEPDELNLKYKGVSAIDSVEFLYDDGASRTLEASNIRFDGDGRVVLLRDRIPNGKMNVRVTYTHGYTNNDIPSNVKEINAILCSIRIFMAITGGSYDEATMFTLGRKSISIGQQYVNVREVVRQLEVRLNELLKTTYQRITIL